MPKLFGTLRSNVMAGVAGRLSDVALFRAWVNTLRPSLGCVYWNNFISDAPISPNAGTDHAPEGLLIMRNGAVFLWDGTPSMAEIIPRTWHLNGNDKMPYIAIGSGEEMALAAMASGRTSMEAVIIAGALQGTVDEADLACLSFTDMEREHKMNGATDFGLNTAFKTLDPADYPVLGAISDRFPPKPETDPPTDTNSEYLKSMRTKSPKSKILKH